METSFLPLHYFSKGILLSLPLQSHFIVIIISSLRAKERASKQVSVRRPPCEHGRSHNRDIIDFDGMGIGRMRANASN